MTNSTTPQSAARPPRPTQPSPASPRTAASSEGRPLGANLWATLTFPWAGPIFATGPYPERASAERAASHIMRPPTARATHNEGLTWPLRLIPPGPDLARTLYDAADTAPHPWPQVPGTHLILNRIRSRAIRRTPQPPERPGEAAVLAMTSDLVYAVLIGPFPDMKAARFWTWRRDHRSDALDLPRGFCEKVLPLQSFTDPSAPSAQASGEEARHARRSA